MSEKGRRTYQPNFIDEFKKYLNKNFACSTEEKYYRIFGVIVRELINELSEEEIEKLCRKSGYLDGDKELTVIRHLKQCEQETRVGELDFKNPEDAIAVRGSTTYSSETSNDQTNTGG